MGFFKNIQENADNIWVNKAVDIALSDNNALLPGWTQRKHRLLQHKLAYARQETPEILLLGSSRQGFHNKFTDRSYVNAWINSAMLGDRLLTYEAFSNQGVPKKVIIGIDPWMFDANAWRNIQFDASIDIFSEELKSIAPKLELTLEILNNNWSTCNESDGKWLNDMRFESPDYYTQVVKKEKASVSLPSAIESSVAKEHRIMFPDGSFEHAGHIHDKAVEDIWVEASRWGAAYGIYIKNKFFNINPFLWSVFTKFIDYVYENGSEIFFLITPFHPAAYHAYNLVAKDGVDLFNIIENKIYEYTKKYNSQILGSFNPANIASIDDFVDSWHLKRTFIPRLVKNLF